jgi:cytochrome c oxidase subunit 4
MSTTTGSVTPESTHEIDHAVAHAHPSDLKYIKVAIFLAIATALEVATYWWKDASSATLAAVLLPIMVIKFFVVAGYFMHLKFDSPLFTRMFVAGLAFAVGVYSVMLTVFRFWE